MTRDQAYVLLNDIVRDVLENETVAVDDATEATAIGGWDSLAGIGVLAAAEVRFGVRFRAAEAQRVERIGDLVDLILDHSPRVTAG
jgi:acyl carrier protein